MYMGQVKQLKKQRITLGGRVGGNNTQPTHFINLNPAAADSTNLINSAASLESLKKNSSLLSTSAKMKLSVTHKAPAKLQLTMPMSQNAANS